MTDTATEKKMTRILKGVCHTGGDGWKNTDVKGEVVYVWDDELPRPYAPGQMPRVGFSNSSWTASKDHFTFTPVDESEYRAIIDSLVTQMREERNELRYKLDRETSKQTEAVKAPARVVRTYPYAKDE